MFLLPINLKINLPIKDFFLSKNFSCFLPVNSDSLDSTLAAVLEEALLALVLRENSVLILSVILGTLSTNSFQRYDQVLHGSNL